MTRATDSSVQIVLERRWNKRNKQNNIRPKKKITKPNLRQIREKSCNESH